MSVLVADCPRCGASRMTLDVECQLLIGARYEWKRFYELFCICRNCRKSTIFVVSLKQPDSQRFTSEGSLVANRGSLNAYFDIERFVSLRDRAAHEPPDYTPDEIAPIFSEAATCLSVECWNAAGAMFRACVDLATRPLLPNGEVEGLNSKVRRDLGLRLPWLFKNGLLAADLNALSACIKEDGNDGAHAGTLKKEEAEDLLDFTRSLLERLYAEPGKLKDAARRREERRQPKT